MLSLGKVSVDEILREKTLLNDVVLSLFKVEVEDDFPEKALLR